MRVNGAGAGDIPRVLLLHVLNRAAALDAADGEAGRVGEAADHPRLPLERALHRLVELGRVLEVDDVDVAVGRAHDAQVLLDIHRVHAVLARHRRRGALLPHVPVLDRLVPAARHEHGVAPALEEANGAHGHIVRARHNLLLAGQVAHLDVLVRA